MFQDASRQTTTLWALFCFVLLLIGGAILSELFRAPSQRNDPLGQYRTLFSAEQIQKTKYLKVDNQLGVLELAKSNEKWRLTSPRQLPAVEGVIKQILGVLQNIKVLNVYEKDPINVSNFSLKTPILSVSFGESPGEIETIELGLVNPIDETLYIAVESQNAIFQVNSFEQKLEKLNLPDFIDTRIFNIDKDHIVQFSIYNRAIEAGQKLVHFERDQATKKWQGKDRRKLDQIKVNQFIDSVIGLRSQLILDQQSQQQVSAIEPYLKKPQYTIEIITKSGGSYDFIVSKPVSTIPGIKIEKRQNVLIYSNTNKRPFFINKSNINILKKKQRQFRL